MENVRLILIRGEYTISKRVSTILLISSRGRIVSRSTSILGLRSRIGMMCTIRGWMSSIMESKRRDQQLWRSLLQRGLPEDIHMIFSRRCRWIHKKVIVPILLLKCWIIWMNFTIIWRDIFSLYLKEGCTWFRFIAFSKTIRIYFPIRNWSIYLYIIIRINYANHRQTV